MFAIVIALLGLTGCGRADIPNVARGVWLADAVASLNARCLDGTPAHYYVRRATSSVNATKWYIHQQGGGSKPELSVCLFLSLDVLLTLLVVKGGAQATQAASADPSRGWDLLWRSTTIIHRWILIILVREAKVKPSTLMLTLFFLRGMQ